MADAVIFEAPRAFVPREPAGDDDTFQAMARFRVLPNNQLELIEIEGHKIGAGAVEQNGPRRIARAARRQLVAAGSPAAAPVGAVPAVAALPGAPVAVQPGFAGALAQRFRTATGRR